MATPPREEIFDKVRQALVEALSVEDDEVTEDATLFEDLGAESIDFLDIIFRLEKAFGIKIKQEELAPQDILGHADYVQNGKLNDQGLAVLKERIGQAQWERFEQDRSVDRIQSIFTVGTIMSFVERKLAES
jgi:acyl carrier protein